MSFPQLDCGHVLAHFIMLLGSFPMGYLSAVVLVPWLGRCEESPALNIR